MAKTILTSIRERMGTLKVFSVVKILFYGGIFGGLAFMTQERVRFAHLFEPTKPRVEVQPQLPRVQTVKLAEAIRMFHATGTLFLDVRERPYYEYGHISGALSLPFDEIQKMNEKTSEKIKKAKVIIVYCGDALCGFSYKAGNILKDKGLDQVYVYEEGWKEWRFAGLPVVMSAEMKRDIERELSYGK